MPDCLPIDEITKAMAKYGWTDLWYANPFPKGAEINDTTTNEDRWVQQFGKPSTGMDDIKDRLAIPWSGPRWHVGVWTGPDSDLVCLKDCNTKEEAERWLSPGGWTPADAVHQAKVKLKILETSNAG